MREHNILYNSFYENKELIERTHTNQGFHTEILDRAKELIDYMTNKRKKNYGIVLTLNFPMIKQYPMNNEIFLNFLERVKYYFKEVDYGYLWVMEKTRNSHNIHYHLLLICDGYKVKSFFNHGPAFQAMWAKTLGIDNARGLVHYENKGKFLNTDNNNPADNNYFHKQYNELIKWSSYLAKIRDKVNTPGVRNWNSSQVRSMPM